VPEVVLDLRIHDGRFLAVQLRHLLGNDVERDDLIVLREQDGIGQPNVACSGNGDFHYCIPCKESISAWMDRNAAGGSAACVIGRPITR